MKQKSKTGLNHDNARTEEQKTLMRRIEVDGVCPFCAEYFTKYHPNPILRFWFVTLNMSPYEGTQHHFLFVYKPKHITSPNEFPSEAATDLFSLIAWVIKTNVIEGGSFFMRFGNTQYNGSSVEHLHAQLIMGKKQDDDAEALRVKLGWKI
jgi:diadenosine tetraphosphate (Ap4A) HIT family hydrolase